MNGLTILTLVLCGIPVFLSSITLIIFLLSLIYGKAEYKNGYYPTKEEWRWK